MPRPYTNPLVWRVHSCARPAWIRTPKHRYASRASLGWTDEGGCPYVSVLEVTLQCLLAIPDMRKIFHFDSPAEPYVADAAVLCCFDHRISQAVRKFLRKQNIERPDMIVVAGGAKTLASPRNDFEQDFILEQVRMSIRLHQTRRVLVMSHSDCATYGGLTAFGGSQEREAEHHKQELQRAADLILSNFPEVDAECFFVTFEGVLAALGAAEQVA